MLFICVAIRCIPIIDCDYADLFPMRTLYRKESRLQVTDLLVFGYIGGIIINPFFPENIPSYFFNFIRISADDTSIRIGQEWYPYTTLSLLKDSGFVFIVFLGRSDYC